jgi:asparagine synthase (glutamine-hydrolysing)
MCGITGFWRPTAASEEELTTTVRRMAGTLQHRGPDDSGVWVDADEGVAFGFQRLSIIDLSPSGHQPMSSPSGRYTVVFNGEIYNHLELATELRRKGHTFRGHSDTEVALAAIEEWGAENAVRRFVGMFAMALWDKVDRSLRLIRDRVGIKPLFVYRRRGVIAFASELKGLMSLPGFEREIDTDALASFFRNLYVPAPRSIFRGVSKLPPGHFLEIKDPGGDATPPRPFWSIAEVASLGRQSLFGEDGHEAIEALDAALLEAVRLRMRSDVPVGAFLSGGIDSSTVVALMQELSPHPVRTFSVGFDVSEHDETSEAAAVARHLGTSHQEIRLSGSDALSIIPRLPDIFDEPLADPSQLPTYLICEAAKREVTVAVSGDGGDELFAGYNRYTHGVKLIRQASRLPLGARRAFATALLTAGPGTWDRASAGVAAVLRRKAPRLAGDKAHKLAHLLSESSQPGMYQALMSAWRHPPMRTSDKEDTDTLSGLADHSTYSMLERMLLVEQGGYLPDDLLAKVDRASMAVGLEVRVPILDHRVVELSWRMPERVKIRNGQGKWILRQVLARRVPNELTDRPKVGFSVPLAQWLRGPLKNWTNERLDPERLAQVPDLDGEAIQSVWKGFLEGRNNSHLAIWAVAMFEAWRERWEAEPLRT